MTLPSNSSMQYFPGNKTTLYTTQLTRSVKLSGEWEVALAEIQYPCTFYTVSAHENYINYHLKTIGKDGKNKIHKKEVRIIAGYYRSIDDIISAINQHPKLCDHINIVIEKNILRIRTHFINNTNMCFLKLSPKLSLQLGYEPETDLYAERLSYYNSSNLYHGIPSQMFVYCDIVEQQFVGDVLAPLLRNIHVDISNYIHGSSKMITFSPLHYIPVLRRDFQNIEIDIRCVKGEPVPFMFGTLSVKLHFRRCTS